MKTHAGDHADNFAHHIPFLVVADISADPFADRIFAGKILFGHRLIDNHDPRRVLRVPLVKSAAAQQWHLKGRKIITADDFEIAIQHIRRQRPSILFAPETSLPSAHERAVRTDCRVLHTCERAHFIKQRLDESVDLVVVIIFLPRQFEARSEERARLVA